jgi:septal ring factor EnvC (AmiA/AmiB activator)
MINAFFLFIFLNFSVANDIQEIEKKVSDYQDKLYDLNKLISIQERTINDLESEITNKKESINKQKLLFKNKFKFLVLSSAPSGLEFILNLKDYGKYSLLQTIIYKIIKDDLIFYKNLKVELDELEEIISLVNLERDNLKKKSIEAKAINEDLENYVKQKKHFLNLLNSDIEYRKKQASRFKKSNDTINKYIVFKNSLDKNLDFIPPVKGNILKKHGKFWDSKLSNWVNMKGLLISPVSYEDIHSVEDGIVEFSGWIDSYGKVIILKHSNNYFSIYGHLSKIFIETGALVRKNDIIGKVGNTGSVDEPMLYFELRKGKNTIDPTFLF